MLQGLSPTDKELDRVICQLCNTPWWRQQPLMVAARWRQRRTPSRLVDHSRCCCCCCCCSSSSSFSCCCCCCCRCYLPCQAIPAASCGPGWCWAVGSGTRPSPIHRPRSCGRRRGAAAKWRQQRQGGGAAVTGAASSGCKCQTVRRQPGGCIPFFQLAIRWLHWRLGGCICTFFQVPTPQLCQCPGLHRLFKRL
jgi:hypothetical protein